MLAYMAKKHAELLSFFETPIENRHNLDGIQIVELIESLVNEVLETEDLKLRSQKTSNDDLSTRITNVYKFFDEIKFTDEINDIIVDLKEGEEFELSLKDASGVLIKFILVKTYKSNDGSQCKNIAFKEKTLLNRSDTGTNLNLSLCKKEDRYELVSINLSK